eukprot:3657040-Pleurochrysis_carterae.AAC.1
MYQARPDCHTLESLLNIADIERVRAVASARELFDCVFAHRTKRLTGVTATASRISENWYLHRHNKAHHMRNPASKLRVQPIQIARDGVAEVEVLQCALLA